MECCRVQVIVLEWRPRAISQFVSNLVIALHEAVYFLLEVEVLFTEQLVVPLSRGAVKGKLLTVVTQGLVLGEDLLSL